MKIGLLIPSRERLNLKLTLISSIITTVDNVDNINIHFGIDADDPTLNTAHKLAHAIPCIKIHIIENEGKFIGINKIWNTLAKQNDDDIFGYIGDDMIFRTKGWDTKIKEQFNEQNLPKDQIKMVHCWDGFQGEKLSVNAFVHRKYYEVMGYFCRPEFLINYSDSWMYQMFKAFDRKTYLQDVFIEHNHWVFKRREIDDTAKRMLSNGNDKASDIMWANLRPQHHEDIKKLGEYLNMTPDWSKVDP
jgi:hypothetical protein